MEEKLVEYPTAVLAKEKGFNIPVIWGYQSSQETLYVKSFEEPHCYNVRGNFSAPTQSLLAKWLREVHNIIVYVAFYGDYRYFIKSPTVKFRSRNGTGKKIYEEALEEGLQEALKLIKQ